MGITSFEGVQGTGKTTAAVAFAYREFIKNKRKVISNVHLNFPYQHFDIAYFLENIASTELEDCVLLLDETYQIFDSRSSQTKLNKLFTYFFVQTRKRGVELYICTHHIDHIDKRGRRAVDVRGACKTYMESPCKKCKGKPELMATCERCLGYGKVGTTVVHFLDRRIRKTYSIEIPANNFWGLFSTKERIPIQAKLIAGIDTAEVV